VADRRGLVPADPRVHGVRVGARPGGRLIAGHHLRQPRALIVPDLAQTPRPGRLTQLPVPLTRRHPARLRRLPGRAGGGLPGGDAAGGGKGGPRGGGGEGERTGRAPRGGVWGCGGWAGGGAWLGAPAFWVGAAGGCGGEGEGMPPPSSPCALDATSLGTAGLFMTPVRNDEVSAEMSTAPASAVPMDAPRLVTVFWIPPTSPLCSSGTAETVT